MELNCDLDKYNSYVDMFQANRVKLSYVNRLKINSPPKKILKNIYCLIKEINKIDSMEQDYSQITHLAKVKFDF